MKEGGRGGEREGLPFLLLSSPLSGNLTGGGVVLGVCLVTSAHCWSLCRAVCTAAVDPVWLP